MTPASQQPADNIPAMPVDEYLDHHAEDCDLLLWRPTSFWGNAIAWWTRGRFSHITAVLQLGGEWMSVGLEEKSGRGVVIPLSAEVKRWPCKIHVFRPNGLMAVDRQRIKTEMIGSLGASYGWAFIVVLGFRASAVTHLLAKVLYNLPVGHCLTQMALNWSESTSENNTGAICSSFIHRSFLLGSGKCWFSKHDSFVVTPNEISDSVDLTEFVVLTRTDGKTTSKTTRWHSARSSISPVLAVVACVAWAWILYGIIWGKAW